MKSRPNPRPIRSGFMPYPTSRMPGSSITPGTRASCPKQQYLAAAFVVNTGHAITTCSSSARSALSPDVGVQYLAGERSAGDLTESASVSDGPPSPRCCRRERTPATLSSNG